MSIDKPPPSSRVAATMAIDAGPRSAQRHGVLTVANGLEAGRVLVLPDQPVVSFGRAAESTFSFDENSLSREHAVVMRIAGEYFIKDNSTNGTFVNDTRLATPTLLREGDRIQLGSNVLLRFAFVDDEEEAALRRVYEAAILDGLTGVFNRKHLEERIAVELAAAIRNDEALSVIIIDVDHFKKVNDTYGHLGGDAVLKSVSGLLKRSVRPEDVVARYGGEEFVVLMKATEVATAVKIADQLRETVAASSVSFETHTIRVTSSAGVASLACCAVADRATLLGTADKRLYAAKEGGRNRVVGP